MLTIAEGISLAISVLAIAISIFNSFSTRRWNKKHATFKVSDNLYEQLMSDDILPELKYVYPNKIEEDIPEFVSKNEAKILHVLNIYERTSQKILSHYIEEEIIMSFHKDLFIIAYKRLFPIMTELAARAPENEKYFQHFKELYEDWRD